MTTIDALRRDPIIRIYVTDFFVRRSTVYLSTSRTFRRGRRSLERSQRVARPDADQAYKKYWEAEHQIYSGLLSPGTSELEQLSRTVDNARETNEELQDAANFFIRSRRTLTRFTDIDSDLANIQDSLAELGKEIDLINAAVSGNEAAKKQIYDQVLGKKLEQLDAPYLFEIINFLVEIATPPPAETSTGATEALAHLAKQAADLAERLERTNVDKRFSSALRDYVDVLTEQAFSPIKAELFSNRLRAYLFELKDELPGFTIAEVSALLLSQEQVLRQFPVWRAFETDASHFSPGESAIEKHKAILEKVSSETKKSNGVASGSVLDALDRLEESTNTSVAKKTTELGVWRSLDNFIKANLRYAIDSSRTLEDKISKNQYRYLKYVERLIPHLKLFIAMKENLTWLLPVLQWLEEYIKSLKQPP